MKFSIATVSVSGELEDKLTAISNAGFDGVEFFEHDLIMFNDSPSKIANLATSLGLKINLFQPGYDIDILLENDSSRALDRLDRTFDLMKNMGTELLLLSQSAKTNEGGENATLTGHLREFGKCAARHELKIGYRKNSSDQSIQSLEDAWEIIRNVDLPNVGLILDSFHISQSPTDMEFIPSISDDKIFHVQLSDAPDNITGHNHFSEQSRCMPGEGDLPLQKFVQTVINTGYNGPLSLVIANDDFRSAMPKSIASDGFRSLLFLMDQVRNTAPKTSIDMPDMPARGTIEGIEFLEFTTNAKDAEGLAKVFSSLGFAQIANHVSKSVTLWQQGEIRLLINTETSGYAHSAYVLHGTCVCDMGLLVSDANSAMERAGLLGANTHIQTISEREIKIPAIRGVGGSVVHFLDHKSELAEVWKKEFEPIAVATSHEVGLTRVDHIAQTMRQDELHSWTLFYLSIFDVAKTPLIKIDDPRGAVSSRAIENSDGGFRLTMNGVNSHQTFAGRFHSDSSGSAFQHIALATNNILKTADSLLEKGFEAVSHSKNYYSSLISRYDLDEKFVAELARLNIMYDRDESGEYLQLYGKPIGDGFFFEIIERRNGYNGYGASNAAYRTAAQKQTGRTSSMPRR